MNITLAFAQCRYALIEGRENRPNIKIPECFANEYGCNMVISKSHYSTSGYINIDNKMRRLDYSIDMDNNEIKYLDGVKYEP